MREKVYALLSLAVPVALALSLLAAPARASYFTLASSGGTFSGGDLVINPFTADVGPGDIGFPTFTTPFGTLLEFNDVGIQSASGGIADNQVIEFHSASMTVSDTMNVTVTHNATGGSETVAATVVAFANSGSVFAVSIGFPAGVLGPVQGLFDFIGLNIILAGGGPFSAPGAHGLIAESLRIHVPEPATLGLFGLALAGLGFARRRRPG